MFIIFHELLYSLKKTSKKIQIFIENRNNADIPLIKNCNKSSFTELKLSVSCSFCVSVFVL